MSQANGSDQGPMQLQIGAVNRTIVLDFGMAVRSITIDPGQAHLVVQAITQAAVNATQQEHHAEAETQAKSEIIRPA